MVRTATAQIGNGNNNLLDETKYALHKHRSRGYTEDQLSMSTVRNTRGLSLGADMSDEDETDESSGCRD